MDAWLWLYDKKNGFQDIYIGIKMDFLTMLASSPM